MIGPLSAKFIKWSNTLKQIVGKLPTICLSVFDHFSGLALKGLRIALLEAFFDNAKHILSVTGQKANLKTEVTRKQSQPKFSTKVKSMKDLSWPHFEDELMV